MTTLKQLPEIKRTYKSRIFTMIYRDKKELLELYEHQSTECIAEGILAEFLRQNRAEAKHMSIYEYNEEEHMRMEREEYFAKGHAQGHAQGHAEGVADERSKLFELIDRMEIDGMAKEIPRLTKEPKFLEEMLKKYNLQAAK